MPTLPTDPQSCDATLFGSRFATVGQSPFYRGQVTVGDNNIAVIFASDDQLELLDMASVVYIDSSGADAAGCYDSQPGGGRRRNISGRRPLTPPHSGRHDVTTTTVDVGTFTEEDFAPRRPGRQDHITIATAVLRSPAVGPDVVALSLTPFPVLQVEQDAIQLAARTAAEAERQLMTELMWGMQSAYATGGVPCAYQWLLQFMNIRASRPL